MRKPGHLAAYDTASADRMIHSLRIASTSYDKAFDKLAAEPPLRLRRWIDEELAELVSRGPETPVGLLAAGELRRREAWRGPARWSLVVAALALLVSAAAFARTF